MNTTQKLNVTILISDKVDGTNAMVVSQKLDTTDERAIPALMGTKLYDSVLVALLSAFLGLLGVNRFYIKSYGIAVGKLSLTVVAFILSSIGIGVANYALNLIAYLILTGAMIWSIVDIFMCHKALKTKNFLAIMSVLDRYPAQSNQDQPNEPQYRAQPKTPFGV